VTVVGVTVTVGGADGFGATAVPDGAPGDADVEDATGVGCCAEHPAINATARKGSIRFMFGSIKSGRAARGGSMTEFPTRLGGFLAPPRL
jgi:hypothetical protein